MTDSLKKERKGEFLKNPGDTLQIVGGLIMVIGIIASILGGIVLLVNSANSHSYYSSISNSSSNSILGWIVLIGGSIFSFVSGLLISTFGAIAEKYLNSGIEDEDIEDNKNLLCKKCGNKIEYGDLKCSNCKELINWDEY